MGYRSNEDMAEDNHSSAVVLISVGAIGLLADIYMLIKNPLSMPMFNKYMTTGIMGSLFVLFIVMGALAMRNYKRFTEAAVKESTLSEKIHEWCVDNLTAKSIEDAVNDPDYVEVVNEPDDLEGEEDACDTDDLGDAEGACDTDDIEDTEGSYDSDDTQIASDTDDAVIFYKRTTYMKNCITQKFMNLDDDMLDRFVEKYYSEIFS